LFDIASACFSMSFIFVLFMLHLLTVCALYVCLCDYVNICMYLVLRKCNIKSTKIKDILKHAEAISNKHKITKQH
jgi:hypothetical protein